MPVTPVMLNGICMLGVVPVGAPAGVVSGTSAEVSVRVIVVTVASHEQVAVPLFGAPPAHPMVAVVPSWSWIKIVAG